VACLMPLLNGCASSPIITSKTEIQRIPAALLSPLEKPLGAKTYRDAIELAEKRGKVIDEYEKRLEDIRAWSAQ
jgi:hypothetical protein